MAHPLSLSLQAFPSVDKDKQSLQYLISRINDQRGSFRYVSEQGLEDEIREGGYNEGVDSQEEVVEAIENGGAAKTKSEEVFSAREEILKQITKAHHESVQALDFVSLLLSGKIPAVAQTTITPYIKQNLPLGSLGGEAVQNPPASEEDKHNEEMASIGWRMQSLNGAADSLLKSASRLETEMEKETIYWDSVLAVNNKGWSLSRLLREKYTLGVRYGFAEAYSDFRDRGLAALRRTPEGGISLDRGHQSTVNQRLRVRVLEQGRPVASTAGGTNNTLENQSIEKDILYARNSIFDEELHHELHREARNLVNQGVHCVNGRVLLPYEAEKQIELDLIPFGEEEDDVIDSPDDHTIAETILISLRTLISYAHRQSLHSRSQIPPPLREHKTPRPIYGLLKPIIEWLQHQTYIENLSLMLETLRKTLLAAGLDLSYKLTKFSRDVATHDSTKRVSFSIVDDLLRTMTSPHHSTIKIGLPDTDTSLTIDVHTALQQYGTSFQVSPGTMSSSLLPTTFARPVQFTDIPALGKHILQHTTLAILQHIISSTSHEDIPWHIVAPHGNSIIRNTHRMRGKEMVTIDLSRHSLAASFRRNGMQGEQVIWNGIEKSLEGGAENRALVDIVQHL